ncbi:MAG: T9SS C-terminal target domain-containing protein [Bacteroidetes bacterium]|nr:MAG: T9SS C-terminal target domain-containing protein [Bacteroidota bacterium]MBL1143373.1 T9SS C-terminal target domain-containing protein [Bacteroidota bacterium]MCB0803028.1 T9SS type A sorting domain-containing protein [Flavobacteriales bacterium]NOG56176.1 T9SS type A sorting domain-containing protein [Bacteroidota bacterium]
MKKIITCFIIIAATLSAHSQDIKLFGKHGNLINGDTLVFWHAVDVNNSPSTFDHYDFVNAFNNTNDTLFIDVIREKLQHIPGTSDQLCWGTLCYLEPSGGITIWQVNDPVKTNPQDTAAGDIPLAVYFVHNDNIGEAYYRYDFVDINDRNKSASITINFSLSYLSGLSDQEISQYGFSIYPNPAHDLANINFKSALNFREQYIEVLDITGKVIEYAKIPFGTLNYELNTKDISSGVYFVRLIAEGVQVDTKKIIIE